jgi:hypothetical protein
MFHVGQRVVCVDVKGATCLRRKHVYTCLAIEPEFLRVDCCANPDHENHRWLTRRFRPIVERKADISIFTEMLNPSPQKVREAIGHDLGFTREEIGAE